MDMAPEQKRVGPASPLPRRLRPEIRTFRGWRSRNHAAGITLIAFGVALVVVSLI